MVLGEITPGSYVWFVWLVLQKDDILCGQNRQSVDHGIPKTRVLQVAGSDGEGATNLVVDASF